MFILCFVFLFSSLCAINCVFFLPFLPSPETCTTPFPIAIRPALYLSSHFSKNNHWPLLKLVFLSLSLGLPLRLRQWSRRVARSSWAQFGRPGGDKGPIFCCELLRPGDSRRNLRIRH
ncbi:hypothetical protein DFJ73DRAFT_822803 [Zopfochytrium polystomum]|nr:hypothetical protein DFJ73DRAFT_822803 [Zopfochytrium polystomum]